LASSRVGEKPTGGSFKKPEILFNPVTLGMTEGGEIVLIRIYKTHPNQVGSIRFSHLGYSREKRSSEGKEKCQGDSSHFGGEGSLKPSRKPGFRVRCKIKGCPRTLQSHIFLKAKKASQAKITRHLSLPAVLKKSRGTKTCSFVKGIRCGLLSKVPKDHFGGDNQLDRGLEATKARLFVVQRERGK